ncbi:hypothetical protein [Fuerstiella marisgermanici]|uniref:SGNH hydrolase-type esterase domain-containing protein n=1 Tax=Fuerstiella marisgermanici TaxID=1891926 RepID=A0A1P8WJ61_9PLAN|nr:hypothetical protein [Fuerstiella marisgermanici]APZ94105.1 hypothetical protein Fuma_03726 [Fuerstiella marisgermanici]
MNSTVRQPTAPPRRRRGVKITLWFAVTTALVVVAGRAYLSDPRKADLTAVLPFLQLAAAVVITWRYGRPESRSEWTALFLIHAALIALQISIVTGTYRYWRMFAIQLSLRIALAAIWLLPIVGIVLFAETLRRGRLRWKAWVPTGLGICFAATVILIGLESAAVVIERQRLPDGMNLPTLPIADDGIFRLAAVGGSTMRGFPYAPEWGIAQVAVSQLQHRRPEQSFELLNLAKPGCNLETAVGLLKQLTVRPDVLIVYSGHNEFFHNLEEIGVNRRTAWKLDAWYNHSPTFRLVNNELMNRAVSAGVPRGPARLCGEELATESLLQRRRQRYRNQLTALFKWAKALDIEVVFCVPASDEATFAPIRSLCHNADPQRRQAIEDTWQEVRTLQQQHAWQGALTLCKAILREEPDFAEFLYLAGRSCRQLGGDHTAAAHRYFQQARDLDQFPIRTRSSYCEIGRDVATDYDAAIIDCPQLLQALVADGFVDQRFFLDGVHPNLKTCFVLGTAVADVIPIANEQTNPTTVKTSLTLQDALHQQNVTPDVLARAYRTTVGVLDRYAFFRAATDRDLKRRAEEFGTLADQLEAGQMTVKDVPVEFLSEPDGD